MPAFQVVTLCASGSCGFSRNTGNLLQAVENTRTCRLMCCIGSSISCRFHVPSHRARPEGKREYKNVVCPHPQVLSWSLWRPSYIRTNYRNNKIVQQLGFFILLFVRNYIYFKINYRATT
jgi:hypothetical protein